MVLNALFTEGVQTVETTWCLVGLQADLTDEEFIVDLLGELGSRSGHLKVLLGRGCRVTGERTGGAVVGQAGSLKI